MSRAGKRVTGGLAVTGGLFVARCVAVAGCAAVAGALVAAGPVMIAPAQAQSVDDALSAARDGERERALALLERRLERDPDAVHARFAYARVLARDAQYSAAVDEYDRLLAAHPDNADYLLGKAQALVWAGEPARALAPLARARRLAPEYRAVWQLEARALAAAGDPGDRERHRRLVADARERFPDADWPAWPAPGAGGRIHRYVEGGLGWFDLGGGREDWRLRYAELGQERRGGHAVRARLSRSERFDLVDSELLVGGGLALGRDWSLTLRGTLAPEADVLARRSLGATLRRDLGGGFGVAAGARHAAFANDELNLYTARAERYFGDWYLGWTLTAARLSGASTTVNNRLRVDHHYRPRSRVGVILATGRENESLGDGRFLTDSVRTGALTGEHAFDARWTLNWTITVQRQGDAFTRRGARVGLRYRF